MTSENSDATFDSGEKELTHLEVWDDTLLIKQYDRSMAKLRQQMAQSSDGANDMGAESEGPSVSVITAERNLNTSGSQLPESSNKRRKDKKMHWRIGDPCRCTYRGDGQMYEATVIAIDWNRGFATVRYIGYNNEESIPLHRLAKSHGPEIRNRQICDAETEQEVIASAEDDVASSHVESDLQSDTDGESGNKRTQHDTHRNRRDHRPHRHHESLPNVQMFGSANHSVPMHLPDLPPPPVLIDALQDKTMNEAMHTMLMSWYMTGYHTGYYQGLRHGQSGNQHS